MPAPGIGTIHGSLKNGHQFSILHRRMIGKKEMDDGGTYVRFNEGVLSTRRRNTQ